MVFFELGFVLPCSQRPQADGFVASFGICRTHRALCPVSLTWFMLFLLETSSSFSFSVPLTPVLTKLSPPPPVRDQGPSCHSLGTSTSVSSSLGRVPTLSTSLACA